ncbi:MAG: MerR family transcriptional regulator, partial [Vicinamibacterales bacterium]
AENTLRSWHSRGLVPALRTTSGVRLFQRRDIERVAAQMTARRRKGTEV